jgi:hypothetical protein
MVIIMPFWQNISSNSGIAVISLLFLSVVISPSTRRSSLANALTTCTAFLPILLLPQIVFPSILTAIPLLCLIASFSSSVQSLNATDRYLGFIF